MGRWFIQDTPKTSVFVISFVSLSVWLTISFGPIGFFLLLFPVLTVPGWMASYFSVWKSSWPAQQVVEILTSDKFLGGEGNESVEASDFIVLKDGTSKDLSDFNMKAEEVKVGDYVAKQDGSFKLHVSKTAPPLTPQKPQIHPPKKIGRHKFRDRFRLLPQDRN